MGSFLNRLNRLTEAEQKKKREDSILFYYFNELHTSMFEHIKNNINKNVYDNNHKTKKQIIMSFNNYTFQVSSTLSEYTQKVSISISEDSLNKKIKIILKFDRKNKKWRIIRISHKKISYTMREMKPVMVESFLIILTRYI